MESSDAARSASSGLRVSIPVRGSGYGKQIQELLQKIQNKKVSIPVRGSGYGKYCFDFRNVKWVLAESFHPR
ncbi:hypothetical protein [Nostoc sp.]|uniref:hypothetical protein n=1 Tax=Nostoc sp. TaxID=1180 RepID=UPI003FA60719